MSQKEIAVPKINKNYGSRRKYNLSTHFLLPIAIDIGYKIKGFINSYLYNSKIAPNEKEYKIYIHMENDDLDLVKYGSRYLDHYETKKGGFIYIFNIDDYKRDIEKFLQGKYSMFSDELKEVLCNNSGKPAMLTDAYKILYKTQDRKKQIEELIGQELPDEAELCSIVEVENEIFLDVVYGEY